MTDTEHLIRQAAREIGISMNQEITVTPSITSAGTYEVSFKDRRGIETTFKVPMDAGFKAIHAMLKAEWLDKQETHTKKSQG
jgi:hypothetical protein